MNERSELSLESFYRLAEAYGLDVDDPHMEELYPYLKKLLATLWEAGKPPAGDRDQLDVYVNRILPELKNVTDLDLKDAAPAMTFNPLWGWDRD